MEEHQLKGQLLLAPERAFRFEADVAVGVVVELAQLGCEGAGGRFVGDRSQVARAGSDIVEVEGLGRQWQRECQPGDEPAERPWP